MVDNLSIKTINIGRSDSELGKVVFSSWIDSQRSPGS
jgi:hypothetical protein